eukprot:2367483-Rhodomonas_salina.1
MLSTTPYNKLEVGQRPVPLVVPRRTRMQVHAVHEASYWPWKIPSAVQESGNTFSFFFHVLSVVRDRRTGLR